MTKPQRFEKLQPKMPPNLSWGEQVQWAMKHDPGGMAQAIAERDREEVEQMHKLLNQGKRKP